MKFDWKKYSQGLKKYRIPALVLGIGLLLLLWPAEKEKENQTETVIRADPSEGDELSRLEGRLEQALSEIRGVGEAEVVLTLRSDQRVIYATEGEEKSESDGGSARTTELARISTGSGQEETVEVTRLSPVYQGALVVCDGGEDSRVKLAVTQSVSVLTGLSSDRISVCGRGE